MVIKQGDKIKVDYEGKFDDGTIFDSSQHGDHSHPLEFEVGSGQVIKGFDDAVIGMKKNQIKEFSIAPEDAYGDVNPELKKAIPRSTLPQDKKPEPGMVLIMTAPNGQQLPVKIAEVNEKNVILDLNHPLAGKKLNFKIKVLEINA